MDFTLRIWQYWEVGSCGDPRRLAKNHKITAKDLEKAVKAARTIIRKAYDENGWHAEYGMTAKLKFQGKQQRSFTLIDGKSSGTEERLNEARIEETLPDGMKIELRLLTMLLTTKTRGEIGKLLATY